MLVRHFKWVSSYTAIIDHLVYPYLEPSWSTAQSSRFMLTVLGHCQTCSKAWKIESQARLTPGQLAFPKNASELLPLAYA